MQKLGPFYRSMFELWFWKVEYDSESKLGKQKLAVCDGKG
jgi:hypothetical protein